MTIPPPDHLVLRYLAGKLHGEDAESVRRYLDAAPERRGMTAALRQVLYRDVLAGTPPDARASLAALLARLPRAEGERERGREWRARGASLGPGGFAGRRPFASVHHFARFAVGMAGVVVGAVAFAWIRGVPDRSADGPRGPVRTYVTATGQEARVTLDDGTRVVLAPRTTLRVSRFTDASRLVELDGEGSFDVTHPGGSPFVVRSGVAQARVLGTKFSVRHYATDRGVRVDVVSGRVAVLPSARPASVTLLTAGQAGVVTDTGTTTAEPDVARYTEWVDGRLVFRRAPLDEVLAALTRWYGYEFRLADPTLADGRITVSLSTRSSAEALSTLKLFLNVDLGFDGNVVTLTPHRGSATPVRSPVRRVDTMGTLTREVGR